MDVLIAIGILAFFVLFGAYVRTDLSDHMAEQERLDELWFDEVGVASSAARLAGRDSLRAGVTPASSWPKDAA